MLDDFRVYTGVQRVGVDWRLGGIRFQIPSAAVIFGIVCVSVLVTAGLLAIGGAIGAIAAGVVVVFGLVCLATAIREVSRFNRMYAGLRSTPRETTHFSLIRDIARDPVYTNFTVPDGDDDLYRNF